MKQTEPLRDATRELRVVADELDHTESVAWHSGYLWAGTEAGQLVRIDAHSGSWEVVVEVGGRLLGLAFDGDGRCYVCDSARGCILRIAPGGAVESYVEAVEGRRLVTPNYPALSSDGTLWVTESGTMGRDDGYVFAVPPGGEPRLVSDECRSFPNGLAFSPDERTLYLLESRTARLLAMAHDGGALSSPRCVVSLPQTVPDGLVMDSLGALYVACFQPNRVYHVMPSGESTVFLDDWSGLHLLAPTNGCFGGPALRTLFITSFCWHTIGAIEVETPGHPLPLPHLSNRDWAQRTASR